MEAPACGTYAKTPWTFIKSFPRFRAFVVAVLGGRCPHDVPALGTLIFLLPLRRSLSASESRCPSLFCRTCRRGVASSGLAPYAESLRRSRHKSQPSSPYQKSAHGADRRKDQPSHFPASHCPTVRKLESIAKAIAPMAPPAIRPEL